LPQTLEEQLSDGKLKAANHKADRAIKACKSVARPLSYYAFVAVTLFTWLQNEWLRISQFTKGYATVLGHFSLCNQCDISNTSYFVVNPCFINLTPAQFCFIVGLMRAQ
jgi:hypothetical protein